MGPLGKMRMESSYWKMSFIQPADPDDDRCVMLYGELEEVVGPLTVDMADAWTARFNSHENVAQKLLRSSESTSG
jgi:hypothetical protein